jgi:hypothetical protein
MEQQVFELRLAMAFEGDDLSIYDVVRGFVLVCFL